MINLKEKLEAQSESSNENVIISNSENNLVIDHAPIQNEELIDNIQLSFNKLLIKYKDNKIILSTLERIICNQIPFILEKQNVSYNLSNNNDEIIKKFVSKFISNNYVQYYYIEESDTFIQYLCYDSSDVNYNKADNFSYKEISESNIYQNIFNLITNEPENSDILNHYKNKINNDIVEIIKTNNLKNALPESQTIQNILRFLCPIFFKTKQEAKYLICIIGDILLNINKQLTYCVKETNKLFFDCISDLLNDYFSSSFSLNEKIKYKLRNSDYNTSKIIYFENEMNSLVDSWKSYITKNFFNFYVVSCHYAIRYKGSESFLNKQNGIIKKKINFLKNKTKSDVVDEFIIEMFVAGDENDKIDISNMKLLWKLYLYSHKMPELMYQTDLIEILKKVLIFNNNTFNKLRWKMCTSNFDYFKEFCNTEIEYNKDINDSYEIGEIYDLFTNWLKDNKNTQNEYCEEELLNIIQFIYKNIEIVNNKNIMHIRCKLWNKRETMHDVLNNKFYLEKIHKMDMSWRTAYGKYVDAMCKKKKYFVVSKKYFDKYIDRVIAPQYIDFKNKRIRKEFWM